MRCGFGGLGWDSLGLWVGGLGFGAWLVVLGHVGLSLGIWGGVLGLGGLILGLGRLVFGLGRDGCEMWF